MDKNKDGVSPYIGDPGTWNCKFDAASGKTYVVAQEGQTACIVLFIVLAMNVDSYLDQIWEM